MKTKDTEIRLHELTNGFTTAQVLLTASRLGLFELLSRGPQDIDDLANKLGSDKRALRILCDALAAIGILIKDSGCYQVASEMRKYLCGGGPEDMSGLLAHKATLYESWGKLYDVVKTGKPTPQDAIDPRLRTTPSSFARAMMGAASGIAHETASALNLSSHKNLLDVGGGPGIYTIEFARQHPHLHVSIFDNPETLEIAKENVSKAGLSNRISFLPGNVLNNEIQGDFDCIFTSNLIHAFSLEENQLMINHFAAHLSPSGFVCVKDFVVSEDRTSPAYSAFFAINMLVNTERGDCYTACEIKDWMTNAGLHPFKVIELNDFNTMVLGCRKE